MLHLNNQGPKIISEEMFDRYKSLAPPSDKYWTFDQMFEYWTDEGNPDALRILTLRDLLRQDGTRSMAGHSEDGDKSAVYRQTSDDYGRIIHLGDSKALPAALTGRPKLVNEFARELLYNFEHHLMTKTPQRPGAGISDTCDAMIELLIPRVSEKMAKQLWNYHTCNPDDPLFRGRERTCHIFDRLLPNRKLPVWLTEKLWRTVINDMMAGAKELPPASEFTLFSENKLEFCCNDYAIIIDAIRWLQQNYNRRQVSDMVVKVVSILENCFPAEYVYVDFLDAQEIAPVLPEPVLAARFLARHINALGANSPRKTTSENAHDARNFLYWADGFFHNNALEPKWHYENCISQIKVLLQQVEQYDRLEVY